ncbi:hypothetical protein LTR36_001465 [Oleoguttula mirabilis]|uniref:Secreted protein n=1 Tax=Oleoguttula mirabilis TaxID=1507867 RepID=A0AAV9J2Q6_9PEZI|nr:hypothetical protein LTR36_001465 [Oleoguttula mirabilis]
MAPFRTHRSTCGLVSDWLPDASVNLSDVAADFAKVKAVGMGGLELLGYYLYGNFPHLVAEGGPIPTDWTKYGWGTEAWKNVMDTALQATKDLGLIMDFALGPNQGAGVPAETNDPGIMWDLWPFNISVPVGSTFEGTLPGWGEVDGGEFVAATIGLVLSQEAANYSASPAWIGPVYYNGSQLTLAASSLQDVTDQVDTTSGHLSLSFPADATGIEYQVFAYYQNHTNYHEQAPPWYVNASVPQSPVETFVENGSWVVDHFSSTGAQLVIDFWENYLLGNGTRELIQEVGNFAWEDSQEFGAGALVWYTPDLLDSFSKARGYNLTKYLPLIYQYNNEAPAPLASPDHYYTDEDDGGMSHINDYWQSLTELNQIYLSTFANWSMESLQSQFSAQVVYNLPMDMLANVPYVHAPDAGPANLAGKRIVSSELGAQRLEVYSQTLPELIWDIKRSIAGSVNNFILHGYPYSSNYPNTTWPGFSTFTYRFSNMHGPRQPAWEYYDDYMNWIARTQYVAQSGIPKIDLAFWLKLDQYFSVEQQYDPLDLEQAGYSYEYLSPDNFGLPEAYVVNGTLAPERQAFKALVIRSNDTLTVAGVDKLVEWAHAGLPIIVSGGLPQNLTGYNVSGGTEYVRSALAGIVSLDNVHIVPYDNLAASLQALGFTPRTAVSASRIWYTYLREDANACVTYAFVYNDAFDSEFGTGASVGSVTFETTGVPYLYDAWTGDVSPILAYQQTNTTTFIPLSLAGNQSTIIAFHHNETSSTGTRIVSLPDEVYSASSQLEYGSSVVTVKAGNTTEPVLLSNGTAISLPVPAASNTLSNWTLVVESWSPPSDLYVDQTKAALSNSTYTLSNLTAWNEISDSLRNVSGRGFYSTSFIWPPQNGSADGAVLNLGAIVHTARVWVNGHQLPPLDPTDAAADVGPYLIDGVNGVEIAVTTTLSNVLRPIYTEIRTSGTTWLGPQPDEQAYGLLQPVSVVPYTTVTIQL